MDKSNFYGRSFVSSDFSRVLNAVKSNIMKDLKVATMAIVKFINNDGTLQIESFPQLSSESTRYITCYNAIEDIAVNDIVLVLFCDRNFNTNLSQLKNLQTTTDLSNEAQLHSEQNGVAILKIYTKGTIDTE